MANHSSVEVARGVSDGLVVGAFGDEAAGSGVVKGVAETLLDLLMRSLLCNAGQLVPAEMLCCKRIAAVKDAEGYSSTKVRMDRCRLD